MAHAHTESSAHLSSAPPRADSALVLLANMCGSAARAVGCVAKWPPSDDCTIRLTHIAMWPTRPLNSSRVRIDTLSLEV